MLSLIDIIGIVTGRELNYVLHDSRPGDVRDSLASLERAQRLLGYHPSVSLEEGLRRTWAWFADDATAPANLKLDRLKARKHAPAPSFSERDAARLA